MKKIKVLFMIVILTILYSCAGFNSTKCYEAVQKTYPKATVWKIVNSQYEFIVIDTNCSVYYVYTGHGRNTNITNTIKIK